MRCLIYLMSAKKKHFEHVDLINFLNSPPRKDTLNEIGYMSIDNFYRMLNDDQVVDYFVRRLEYLIDCPEAPKEFTKKQYKLMQMIQNSSYFIPVVYNPDWIPYSLESKYTLIGYLLAHEWETYDFQVNHLEDDVETLVITLNHPIIEDYGELELLLSLPSLNSKQATINVIQDFIRQKPTVYNLLNILKLT